MDTPLNAFWSYSRMTDDAGSGELYKAMRDALRDPISLWGMLEIYRDSDIINGIPSGEFWPQAIIEAVSRSTLFFWVQSPRWLRANSMCSFEFEMFCNRVQRVAQHFTRPNTGQSPDSLLEALVIPVRLFEMQPDDWSLIDDGLRRRFEHEWNERQVHPALDFAHQRKQCAYPKLDYARSCIDAAQPIAQRFGKVLADLKIDLPTLNAFIAADSPDFKRHWSQAYEARLTDITRRQLMPAFDADRAEQQRLTQAIGGKSPRSPLEIPFVLVPDASGERGFWTSATPLPNRLEQAIALSVPGRGKVQRGPGGFLLCSAADADALRVPLHKLELGLPNTEQAVRLQAIFAKGRDTSLRLGFQSVPTNFWFVDEHGVDTGGADSAALRVLMLVAAAP